MSRAKNIFRSTTRNLLVFVMAALVSPVIRRLFVEFRLLSEPLSIFEDIVNTLVALVVAYILILTIAVLWGRKTVIKYVEGRRT